LSLLSNKKFLIVKFPFKLKSTSSILKLNDLFSENLFEINDWILFSIKKIAIEKIINRNNPINFNLCFLYMGFLFLI